MDSFFGIGILELMFIAILALIVLGPERLPGVMREGAKYIRKLRQMGNELTSQFSDELQVLDELNPRKIFNEMTDPNRPEPGEKAKPAPAKTTPAKPPPAKTAPTVAPKTAAATTAATAAARKSSVSPTPATTASTGDALPPATNGHTTAPVEGATDAVSVAAPSSEENSILPPALDQSTVTPQPVQTTISEEMQPAPLAMSASVVDLPEEPT